MFFSEIYGILTQGYLEFVFISLLNLEASKEDPDNNSFNSIYSYIILIITLAIMPLANLYVLL
jgi:hypothetical protein